MVVNQLRIDAHIAGTTNNFYIHGLCTLMSGLVSQGSINVIKIYIFQCSAQLKRGLWSCFDMFSNQHKVYKSRTQFYDLNHVAISVSNTLMQVHNFAEPKLEKSIFENHNWSQLWPNALLRKNFCFRQFVFCPCSACFILSILIAFFKPIFALRFVQIGCLFCCRV